MEGIQNFLKGRLESGRAGARAALGIEDPTDKALRQKLMQMKMKEFESQMTASSNATKAMMEMSERLKEVNATTAGGQRELVDLWSEYLPTLVKDPRMFTAAKSLIEQKKNFEGAQFLELLRAKQQAKAAEMIEQGHPDVASALMDVTDYDAMAKANDAYATLKADFEAGQRKKALKQEIEVASAKERGKIAGRMPAEFSADPEIAEIEKTVQYAGKSPSMSFNQSMNKAKAALRNVENISVLLKEVETGPMRDRWNSLKEMIAGRGELSEIKAQIKALIPNLARGVYGEVGVLTDTDIENYASTVANTKLATDLNQVLIGSTKRAIYNAMLEQIKSEAKSKSDVSGWAGDVLRIKQQLDSFDAALSSPPTPQQMQPAPQPPSPIGAPQPAAPLQSIPNPDPLGLFSK